MGNITWTTDALRDLGAVTAYIAETSPVAAADFTERLANAVRHLNEFPLIGRQVPELGSAGPARGRVPAISHHLRSTRRWHLDLALMHGAMDFSTFSRRRKWNLS